MILPYCVYVLVSTKDGMFYIGYTTDILQRIESHDKGKVKSTKNRRPLRLVFSEFHISKYDALRRERYFKTSAGKKVLKLMLRESLSGK